MGSGERLPWVRGGGVSDWFTALLLQLLRAPLLLLLLSAAAVIAFVAVVISAVALAASLLLMLASEKWLSVGWGYVWGGGDGATYSLAQVGAGKWVYRMREGGG